MSETTQLVRYDAMCRAIAEAHAIDEVKDIRDKARALEMYARMAMNKEAERQAIEIRIRAEDRCGHMLTEQIAHGGDRRSPSRSDDPTLKDLNISKQQSSDWQRLAAIPREQFEADLSDRMWRPTTAGMLERQEAREYEPIPQLRGDEDALWLWGVLYDFEERGLLKRDPHRLMATPMHDHMRDTFRRLAPLIAEWLGGIE
ncbi:MAG TPA: hypothetical protein VGI78_11830 [Acetobacteraceae bacterium]|jgi:hypothetical protein